MSHASDRQQFWRAHYDRCRELGPSSEKDPTPQMRLFNGPEATVEQAEGDDAIVTVPEHKRRKSGRKPAAR